LQKIKINTDFMPIHRFFNKRLSLQLISALQHRNLPIILAVSAILMTLPALWGGLLFDDLWHWAELAGSEQVDERLIEVGIEPEKSGRLSKVLSGLFVVVSPEKNLQQLKQYGALPWWTYDGFKVSAWRPIASFTHWLDYRLLGGSEMIMHAHNILWFAAVVFFITMLYRLLITPRWAGGLAAVFFVLCESNYFPTLWISNRNLILSLFFGVLALLAHHRWRQYGSLAAGLATILCLAGSLLSAEAGAAVFAYIFAYALFFEQGSLRRRLLGLAPATITVVLWRILYNAGGYGAYGGDLYLDPAREPLRYVWAILQRGPLILVGQISSVPVDVFSYIPESKKYLYVLGALVFIVIALFFFTPLLRKDRLARFWLVGTCLSMLPICATIPMSRNLLFIEIGAFGLIAQFTTGVIIGAEWLPKGQVRQTVIWVFCVLLLVAHLPVAAVRRVAAPVTSSMIVDEIYSTMRIDSTRGLEKQELVVLNAPYPVAFQYLPFLNAYEGKAIPRAIRVLSPGYRSIEIIRLDERTISVRSITGNLLSYEEEDPLHFVYFYRYVGAVRGTGQPLCAGEQIKLPRMLVNVVEVDKEGFPVEVSFKFAVSLSDPSLRWLCWDWEKDCYKPLKVPAIGQRQIISGPF
jgi:hypothetical protein